MNKLFFDLYRNHFGKLRQVQVEGLDFLVLKLMSDEDLTLPMKAYVLATVKHETADTYQPIREYGRGRGRTYGKPDKETGQTYYGRGYVQLTWKRNYRTLGALLNVDLVNRPELALHHEISYKVLVVGMLLGLFTGAGLKDYINDSKVDFINARRIVNGTDKAHLIARYARIFLKILKRLEKKNG